MSFTDMQWPQRTARMRTSRMVVLQVTTGERTDFWRETHYGFVRG